MGGQIILTIYFFMLIIDLRYGSSFVIILEKDNPIKLHKKTKKICIMLQKFTNEHIKHKRSYISIDNYHKP